MRLSPCALLLLVLLLLPAGARRRLAPAARQRRSIALRPYSQPALAGAALRAGASYCLAHPPAEPAPRLAPAQAAHPAHPPSHAPPTPPQRANFEFFLAAGTHYPAAHKDVHWVFVVSGDVCTPCKNLYSLLKWVLGAPAGGSGWRLRLAAWLGVLG
jgi:hypothetical protein